MLLNNGICTTPCPYKTPYGICQITACINNMNIVIVYNTQSNTQSINKIKNEDVNDPDFGIGIYS